jgi:nitrile hydratase
MVTMIEGGAPARREIDQSALFRVGDVVRVSSTVPVHHTRKAGYVRGAVGEVTAVHGAYVFPDVHATAGGEDPEYVYTVRFLAEELFGSGIGDENTVNLFDFWESYLAPATTRHEGATS